MAAWLGWLVAALLLYIALLAVIMLMEHRKPAQMTAWLLIALLVPYLGFFAYFMLGRDFRIRRMTKRFEKRIRYDSAASSYFSHNQIHRMEDVGNDQLAEQKNLFGLLSKLAPFAITTGNQSEVLTNGEAAFEAILNAIEKAKHHIHLDYYTIRDDGIGRRFLRTLIRKAREGVEVRLVYDGIGSLHLSENYLTELHAAGVHTSCFLPPRFAFYERRLNYRNHRKIVVVDGVVGFLGGINIGDEYLGKDKRLGFWRDTHLKLQGNAVHDLQRLFLNDWTFASQERLEEQKYMPKHASSGKESVLIVPSEPGRNDQKILDVTFAAINAAKSRICISTPYFIPDPSLGMALKTAAQSGVDVKIIIPGIADTKLILLATLSYVQDMLDAGVKIYRYRKGFIHAKVMIIDRMLASIGTANMDMRSLYSNFELNAMLFDTVAIDRLFTDFQEDLNNSHQVHAQQFTKRPWKQKAAESLIHMLSPLL
ncbi:cardiolipin synthase [Paenibacillus harenae]|uniref:Cardiolipin synthase n=1 Tax=Paenibacillus harenae TaxID=306543 RepID=A0ABT9U9X9_PAEHA|nr:cardiolipin synthase [Paenibacillus harenae]MDQ0115244.1 cardiolipin synthase [Paenibacillus harenae]